ncbi:MAG: hypothetical protein ACYTG0_35305 [Planctomycetota bacterium]
MSNNRTLPLESLLATAVITAFHAFGFHANAQELRQPVAGKLALQTGAESAEVTALRRDFDEVARLLRAQQEQIEQQSLRLDAVVVVGDARYFGTFLRRLWTVRSVPAMPSP